MSDSRQLSLSVDPLADAAAIPLGRGLFTIVDRDDVPLVSTTRWYACRMGKTWYAYRRTGRGVKASQEYMHRVLLGLRRHDGHQVDHANGNGLDNRRANLRLSTNAENGRNRGPNRNNTSGYKRVCWHKSGRKWFASIQVDGVQISLGLFADPIDAALAYDLAAIKHHGAFAWTNFLVPPGRDVKREHGIPFATRAARADEWERRAS
jgi:hypothetical protein